MALRLVTGSDGWKVLGLGLWAKDKLSYIRAYCDIFNVGMKRRWTNRVYIDLFAGPGRCLVRETGEEISGSPLIALHCKEPFTHYFFNDADPQAIAALKSRVGPITKVQYLNEDCNTAVGEIIGGLPSAFLGFCFVDPTGFQVKFDSIAQLTAGRRIDLAVTFQAGFIKRWAREDASALDQFFGDAGWRSLFDKAPRGEQSRVLLDHYEGKLRTLGYREFKDFLLFKNKKDVPLYYLLFASKHPRGADFWDKISQRSVTGQTRLTLP